LSGIAADTPLLILPGSRTGAVKRHLPVLLEAAKGLPDYKVVIFAAPRVRNRIEDAVTLQILVIDIAEKQDSFAAATIALSKSGTIARAGVPTVVAHKVTALSAGLIRRMALIPFVSLVNIVAKKEIRPELSRERCTPERIAQELMRVARPDVMLEQRQQCLDPLEMLPGRVCSVPMTPPPPI
jgi:lipid-A-disaccharide synthase